MILLVSEAMKHTIIRYDKIDPRMLDLLTLLILFWEKCIPGPGRVAYKPLEGGRTKEEIPTFDI